MSKQKIISYTKEELENLDINVVIVRGVLYAYGVVEIIELLRIIKRYKVDINKKELLDIIKNEESINKDFIIKKISYDGKSCECVVYKNMFKFFSDNMKIVFDIDKRRFKKQDILAYSKHYINTNDKYIFNLISKLKEIFDENSLRRIMYAIFEILNYKSDVELIEITLFDEIVNKQKLEMTGKEYVSIRNLIQEALMYSPSWKCAGNNAYEISKEIEEAQIDFMIEQMQEAMYGALEEDYEEYEDYDFNDDESIPF